MSFERMKEKNNCKSSEIGKINFKGIDIRMNYVLLVRGLIGDLSAFREDLENLLKKHHNVKPIYVKASPFKLWVGESKEQVLEK